MMSLEASEVDLIAVIKIGGINGNIHNLNVYRNDDPVQLATKFAVENFLPSEIIPKLSQRIQSQIDQVESVDQSEDDSTQSEDDSSTESISQTFNELLRKGSTRFENKIQPEIRPVEILASSETLVTNLEESFYKARDTWSTSPRAKSPLNVTNQNNLLSSMKKSRSESNLVLSISNPLGASSSRPKSPSMSTPKSTHDRLFLEATFSQQRLDRLREQVEEKRQAEIKNTSFIETIARSPASVRGVRTTASPNSSITGGGGRRRSLSGSYSTSSLLAKTQDGDDIHPNEYLYYCQQQWEKDKNNNIKKLAKRVESERLESEMKEVTLQPKLSTSKAMQMLRSQSPNQVFTNLYDSSKYYTTKRKEQKDKLDREFDKQYSFIPQITPNSKRLASRRLLERSFDEDDDATGSPRVPLLQRNQCDDNAADQTATNNAVTSSRTGEQMLVSSETDEKYTTGVKPHYQSDATVDPMYVDGPVVHEDAIRMLRHEAALAVDNELTVTSDSGGNVAMPQLSVDWNPFDSRSKHYSKTSPPTLLSASSVLSSPVYISTQPNCYSYSNNDFHCAVSSNGDITSKESSTAVRDTESRHTLQSQQLQHPSLSLYRSIRELGKLKIENPSPSVRSVAASDNKHGPTNVSKGAHPYRGSNVYDKRISATHSTNKQTAQSNIHYNNNHKSSEVNRVQKRELSVSRERVSADCSLFDRLYQARNESAQKMNDARNKHAPQFPHTPRINASSRRVASHNNDDAVHIRLFDHYNDRVQKSVAEREALERQRLDDIRRTSFIANTPSKATASAVNSVSSDLDPRKKSQLTAKQTASHVNRLLESKQKVAIKVESAKNRIEKFVDSQAHSRFICSKSASLVSTSQSAALNEIFSVLLVTTLLHADEERRRLLCENKETHSVSDSIGCEEQRKNNLPSPEMKSASVDDLDSSNGEHVVNNVEGSAADTKIDQQQQLHEQQLLDTVLAQPGMLQPKLLADCITAVLNALRPQKLSRKQFIEAMQCRMNDGSLPPIGYLLMRPAQINNKSMNKHVLSSEQLELQKCTSKPLLKARAVTDALVKSRYELRRLGRQSVEDSLISYRDFQDANRMERKVQLEKEAKRECSFAPNLQSAYMIPYRGRVGRADGGGVDGVSGDSKGASRSKRSNSAPPRTAPKDSSTSISNSTADAKGEANSSNRSNAKLHQSKQSSIVFFPNASSSSNNNIDCASIGRQRTKTTEQQGRRRGNDNSSLYSNMRAELYCQNDLDAKQQ